MPKSTKVAKTEEEIRLHEMLRKQKRKEYLRIYQKGYRKTDNGKAAIKRYNVSDNGKAAKKRYNASDNGKAVIKRYEATGKGKAARRRYKQQPRAKIANVLRIRVHHALKSQPATKSAPTMDLIGCSVEEFKEHIQSQFTEGMSWENHGVQRIGGEKRWHLDHIRPCSSFDLNDREQRKVCFHYTNQQPLWAEENWRKGAKLPDTN